MTGHSIAGSNECPVCGGPCKQPWAIPAVHDRYPFMNPEAIRMTQEREAAANAEPEPPEPKGKRARRLREDRAHRPSEDR